MEREHDGYSCSSHTEPGDGSHLLRMVEREPGVLTYDFTILAFKCLSFEREINIFLMKPPFIIAAVVIVCETKTNWYTYLMLIDTLLLKISLSAFIWHTPELKKALLTEVRAGLKEPVRD